MTCAQGNWYHVATVFISSMTQLKDAVPGVYFYVNGQREYVAELPKNEFGIKPCEQNNLPLRIGRSGHGDQYWHGMIDDVSIWNKPLSANRIRRLLYERLGGNEKGLVAYYGFNEGTGDILFDHSKNRRHGKIHSSGPPVWIASETKELILHPCV